MSMEYLPPNTYIYTSAEVFKKRRKEHTHTLLSFSMFTRFDNL